MRSLSEQEAVIRAHAKSIHANYHGINHVHPTGRRFELTKEGFANRLITLDAACRRYDPFNRPVLSELEDELRQLLKQAIYANVRYSNRNKLGEDSNRLYELIKGNVRKWVPLTTIRKGHDPFKPLSILEQEAEVRKYVKEIGAFYRKITKLLPNGNRVFVIGKRGWDDREVSLSQLRTGKVHFTKRNLAEQLTQASKSAKKVGLELTGKQKQISGRLYLEVREIGKNEKRYISSGNLNALKNPFKSGGFDTSKAGWLYAFKVIYQGQEYIKIGITNVFEQRQKEHRKRLHFVGATCELITKRYFRSGWKCQDAETALKAQFKHLLKGFKCNGFQDECYAQKAHQAILKGYFHG